MEAQTPQQDILAFSTQVADEQLPKAQSQPRLQAEQSAGSLPMVKLSGVSDEEVLQFTGSQAQIANSTAVSESQHLAQHSGQQQQYGSAQDSQTQLSQSRPHLASQPQLTQSRPNLYQVPSSTQLDPNADSQEMLRRKVESVDWLQNLLRPSGIFLVPGEPDNVELYGQVDLHEQLKSGALLCKALNTLMSANPSFVQANLPLIEVNERTDLFASLSNLNNFVRTCELYFNVDRDRLFNPVEVLEKKDETPFINALSFLRLVVEQIGVGFPVYTPKPFTSLTFDHLSTLVTMLTQKPGKPVVAYDPRVVMSVQDVETFQRLVSKLDVMEASHKTFSVLATSMNARLAAMEAEQREIRTRIDGLVEGVLGAFDDVSNKLRDLKDVTDIIGNSAMGLHSIVQLLETKNDQTNAQVLEAFKLQQQAQQQALLQHQQMLLQQQQQQQISQAQHSAAPESNPAQQSSISQAQPSVQSVVRVAQTRARGNSVAKQVTAFNNQTPPKPVVAAPSVAPPAAKPPMQQQQSQAKVFKLPDEVLAKNLPKEELMRQSVMYEVIDSEADYVRDVNVMLEYHFKQLRLKGLLDAHQLKIMFSNLEELLPPNQELLALIVSRRDENPLIEGIGDLLLSIAPKFSVYEEYCSNYPTAGQLYKEIKSREDFKAWIEKSMNSPECRGLSLESFLIKPVQRICKYPLLLRELIKHTPADHKDRPLLEQAMVRIEHVVAAINEKTRAVGERDKLVEVQGRIDASPALQLQNTPGRRLLKEGAISRVVGGKNKDRHLILLTDVLLLCKQSSTSKVRLQFEQALELHRCALVADAGHKLASSGPASSKKTVFEVSVDGESYFFACQTEQDRARWAQMIEDAIKESQKNPPSGPLQIFAASNQEQQQPGRPASTSSPTPANISSLLSITNPIGALKKRNTLSTRKSSNLFGARKKGMSQESLAEDDSAQPATPAAQPAPPSQQQPVPQTAAQLVQSGHVSQMAQVFSASEMPQLKRSQSTATEENASNRISRTDSVSSKQGVSISQAQTGSTTAAATPSTDNVTAHTDASAPQAQPASSDPAVVEIPGYPQWRAVDAGNGTVYYFNTETNETSWYHPAMVQMAAQYQQLAQLQGGAQAPDAAQGQQPPSQ